MEAEAGLRACLAQSNKEKTKMVKRKKIRKEERKIKVITDGHLSLSVLKM